MIRILRGPDGGEGGTLASQLNPTYSVTSGTINPQSPPAPNPQPPPPQTPPPSPTPTPTPPLQGVLLSPDEHRRLIERIQKAEVLEKAEAEREAKQRQAEEENLRKRGEYEKLITQRDEDLKKERERLADIERRSKASEVDRELSLALAQTDVFPELIPDLMELWRPKLEAIAEGERWRVKTLDGKSPADFVREQLALPKYSHFVRAQNATGATNRGSTTGRTDEAPANPASLGQQAFEHWQQMKEERNKYGFGSVGLKPIAKSS